jgi:glucosamine--fructose-6-phosphate aminotransferase (isomerizing)
MCGIVGYVGTKNPIEVVVEGLKHLEYRGYDSAGLAHWDTGGFVNLRAIGKLRDGFLELVNGLSTANAAIGHTRWATHGGVTVENAHPHISQNGHVAIVHNGIVDNYNELRTWLEVKGYAFKSDTDSEVIAHLIEFYSQDKFGAVPAKTAIMSALKDIKGTYGLAILLADEPDTIYAARNGSPLLVARKDGEAFVASSANAIARHISSVIYLNDGELARVHGDEIAIWDSNWQDCQPQETKLDVSYEEIELGNFPHYMLKEIWEQPDAIQRCFGNRLRDSGPVLGGFNLQSHELATVRHLVLIGCGTSYHAGLTIRPLIEKYCGITCSVEIASEYACRSIIYRPDTLYVAISQSGETFDTIEAIKELQRKGAKVYGIVNVVGSSIARLCASGVYIHAGPEIAVASTKAFTTQLAALHMLCGMIARAQQMDALDGSMFSQELGRIPAQISSMLISLDLEKVKAEATRLAIAPYVLFLGRGTSHPVAMEGALKLREIAYVPCEAYPGGEMKHGPIAMLRKGTPVVAIVPDDKYKERMLANIKEVQARGADVLGIVTQGDAEAKLAVSSYIEIPRNSFSSFAAIIPLQLIAYYAALHLGHDVDKPRNLAKSCTTS